MSQREALGGLDLGSAAKHDGSEVDETLADGDRGARELVGLELGADERDLGAQTVARDDVGAAEAAQALLEGGPSFESPCATLIMPSRPCARDRSRPPRSFR